MNILSNTPEGPPREPCTKRYFYDGSGNLQYEAWSPAYLNSLTSDAAWAIRKFTYDGSNRITISQWANGNSDMNCVLDNRASLTYK